MFHLAQQADRVAASAQSSSIPKIASVVDRPRLNAVLDAGRDYPVTLICAPAGSGKSVAASSWVRHRGDSGVFAWLQCSALADDPQIFWSSAIDALTEVLGPDPAAPVSPRAAAGSDRFEALNDILRWLAGLPDGTTLVCDDFGEIGAAATQREVQYVIDRLPDQVSFLIVTRSYPPLALHRARIEGRLLDVRASDLAFTLEESGELLGAHHLEVGPDDLALLQRRTEGWAAGLRLAVMSMAQAPDPSDVIARLANSPAVVGGYLTEQVLAQLGPDDRDFLLDTCVVDEIPPDMVGELTRRWRSRVDLEQIADRIGFLSQRATDGDTFRFHPLFVELVRTELGHSDPARFRRQHGRAARWHEIRGQTRAAVQHAQAAEDWDQAARLLAPEALSMVLRGQRRELLEALSHFPQDVQAEDPRLALAHAIALDWDHDAGRAAALLERARAGLAQGTDLASRRLAELSLYVSALMARFEGDSAALLSALDPDGPNVPGPDDSGFVPSDLDLRAMWRATRAVNLMSADHPAAGHAEGRRVARDVRAGAASWPLISVLGMRAWSTALDGDLHGVGELMTELTPFVAADASELPYLGLTDFAEAWVAMERGQLDDAGAILASAEGWRQVGPSDARVTGAILQARLLLLNGDPLAATERLNSVYATEPLLHRGALRRLGAWVRVEISLSRGDLASADEAARDGSSKLQAYVGARAGRPPRPDMVWDDHELGLQLRTLLAHAIKLHQSRRREAADQCLDAALDLTEVHGYRLPFVQLGVPAHALLVDARVAAARHGSLVAHLLSVTASGPRGVELTDPLSPRELEVLRHLVAGLDTDEIAGDLYVSRNTVRTHTKSIYRKLAVQNKRQALLRAAALGIV